MRPAAFCTRSVPRAECGRALRVRGAASCCRTPAGEDRHAAVTTPVQRRRRGHLQWAARWHSSPCKIPHPAGSPPLWTVWSPGNNNRDWPWVFGLDQPPQLDHDRLRGAPVGADETDNQKSRGAEHRLASGGARRFKFGGDGRAAAVKRFRPQMKAMVAGHVDAARVSPGSRPITDIRCHSLLLALPLPPAPSRLAVILALIG